MIKICKHCGAEFTANSHRQKFCSLKCKTEFSGGLKKICARCGKEFKAKMKTQKYCSQECGHWGSAKKFRSKKPREMTPALERFFTKIAIGIMDRGGTI